MVDTNPPRGTRDFHPEEMRLRNWLFGHWASVARGFGFEQFDVPVLESEELFVRKAGEEITDQLYNFEVGLLGGLGECVFLESWLAVGCGGPGRVFSVIFHICTSSSKQQDKGGRRVALRPEITPSLARLVLAKGKALALPAKVGFYFPWGGGGVMCVCVCLACVCSG
jgi:histidyl-tRNA synthetase